MIFLPQKTTGFTLIELMVVISIIGVLSSIVMSSISTTRLKARDSKIKQQVLQMRNLFELEYAETNSFASLQPGWFSTTAECNGIGASGGSFTSVNYTTKAREICVAVVNASSNSFVGGGHRFYLGTDTLTGTNINRYSMMAFLPYKQTFFCVGSSGRTSDNTVAGNYANQPGCYSSP